MDIAERVRTLEVLLQNEREDRSKMEAELKKDLEEVQTKLAYYDKMALKWGFFCLGIFTFGAMVWAGADKIKDKLLDRLL